VPQVNPHVDLASLARPQEAARVRAPRRWPRFVVPVALLLGACLVAALALADLLAEPLAVTVVRPVQRTGTVREVPTVDAVEALGRALGASFDPVVCVFTTADTPGVPDGNGGTAEAVEVDAVTDEHVSSPSVVRRLAASDLPVLVTSLHGLFAGPEATGTRVRDRTGRKPDPDS